MNRLWVLHLTDIHVQTAADPVLNCRSAIKSAVLAHEFAHNQVRPATLAVAISGDIAFSGRDSEYNAFASFLRPLVSSLREHFSTVHVVMAPGNHDLVLKPEDPVRTMVLNGYDPSLVDERVFSTLASPQQAFWKFAAAHAPGYPDVPSLCVETTVTMTDKRVVFRSINTSWTSSLHEKTGSLSFPRDMLDATSRARRNTDDAIVTLFHHPYHWIQEEQYRALRGWVELHSDMVLTGHEHISDLRISGSAESVPRLYIEGGALQKHGQNPLNGSSFNIIELDLDEKTFAVARLVLDGRRYTENHSSVARPFASLSASERNAFQLQHEFLQYVDEIGDIIRHERRPNLRLSDVFVLPELSRERRAASLDRAPEIVTDIVEETITASRILIVGPELSGRTSLLKTMFTRLHAQGWIPVYFDFAVCTTQDISLRMSELIAGQYRPEPESGELPDRETLNERGIAIVDNLNALTSVATTTAVRLLEQRFSKIVLCGDISASVPLGPEAAKSPLWRYEELKILELTHRKRGEIIEKWMTLGRDETNLEDLAREIASRDAHLARVVRSTLLPSTPYFVLLALQQYDTTSGGSNIDTSYGHLYEASIDIALRSSESPLSTTGMLDYLAGFAAHLNDELNGPATSVDDLTVPKESFFEWHRIHAARLGIQVDCVVICRALVRARLFCDLTTHIGFRFKNSYYYSLARAFSALDVPETIAFIKQYANELHLEQWYAVTMFLAHLDKRTTVIGALLSAARDMLSHRPPLSITESAGQLVDEIEGLPQMQLPEGDFETRRAAILQERDRLESDDAIVATNDDQATIETNNHPYVERIHAMNSGLRMVHILGQILRRHAASPSLEGNLKMEVVSECYDLGLRVLADWCDIIQTNKEQVREGVLHLLVSQDLTDLSDPVAVRHDVALSMNQIVLSSAFGVVRSVGDAVGTGLLQPTFASILDRKTDNFSYQSFDLAISLEVSRAMPIQKVRSASRMAEKESSVLGSALVCRLVCSAVRRYLYSEREIRDAAAAAGIQSPSASALNPNRKKIKDGE